MDIIEWQDFERVELRVGTIPVSYTHLDVYKRQGLFLFWREARRPSSGLAAQGY